MHVTYRRLRLAVHVRSPLVPGKGGAGTRKGEL